MTEAQIAELARGAQSAGFDFAAADGPETDDPLYCVCRGAQGDVIIHWSKMTDEERERAWREYERAFGTAEDRK